MEFTQPAGMKMPKSWPNRSKIPVCGMQTIANLNQCGIEWMARAPKCRREKGSWERSERKVKAFCLCRAEKAESEEDHTAWPGTARCDGKASTLRRQSQHAAMAKPVHCDGKGSAQTFLGQYAAKRKGTRWFVGLKKPPIDNEHTTPWKEVKINGSPKAPKTIPRYFAMRGQPYLRAKRRCLMFRIHLASWAGALHTFTVQPKAGRSENIYYFAK